MTGEPGVHLWAPYARTIHLRRGDQTIPMEPVAHQFSEGWWRADAIPAPGADYSFILDNTDSLPDPRSPWQPNGVHGPSRFYDHAAFRWTDQNYQPPPLSSALIYELHIGTFTPAGTFDSAIEKLD